MLGVVAGDIIASPYQWTDAPDRYFTLGESTRFYRGGREVNAHPRFTDGTVLSLAVARWLMQDENHSSSGLAGIIRDLGRDYPTCGFSPRMQRFIESDYPRPFNADESAVAMMAVPVGLRAGSLPEAIALARQVASVVSAGEATSQASEAVAQVVWMARHSREKDDIRFTIEKDFGYDLSMPENEMVSLLAGCVKEPIIVNGIETEEFYFRETGKIDSSCQNTVPAAIRAFLEGDSFEDTVRRAVAYGGDSDTIASMAGAIAAPFHGGVPEKISGMCNVYLDSNLRSLMQSFENICLEQRSSHPIKVEHKRDDSFKIIRHGDEKIYVVPSYRKDLIEALKARFGEDITMIKPSEMAQTISRLSAQTKDGTFLENPRPDVRTVYFQEGQFRTSATMTGESLPPQSLREECKREFLQIHDYALEVKRKLQQSCGYHGDGSIHFANAYYPEVFSDKVEIWKGDVFAGSVGIDPQSGLLKINQGGDFGPMEWYGERTDSVFNSVSLENILQSIGRYCLDEGIGIFDKSRTSNIEVATNDVVRSKDPVLSEAITATQQNKQSSLKR